MRCHPSPPYPVPWTMLSHCSFFKRHNRTRWQDGHGHIILIFCIFLYLSISNEGIHLPRAEGMSGENESHLWCPIVQRWLLWTILSPAPGLPKIMLVSALTQDKRHSSHSYHAIHRMRKHVCYHTNSYAWVQNVLEYSAVIGRRLGSLSAWYIRLTVGVKGPESELQHLSSVRTDSVYLTFIFISVTRHSRPFILESIRYCAVMNYDS